MNADVDEDVGVDVDLDVEPLLRGVIPIPFSCTVSDDGVEVDSCSFSLSLDKDTDLGSGVREGEVVKLTLEEDVKLTVAVVLAKDAPAGDSNKWDWTSVHFELISE